MIQELVGSSILLGEAKVSFNGAPHHHLPQPDTSNTTPTSTLENQNNNSNNNIRCPRCDSANTKFCYYNNYNLTQTRHFCKTCRRYWTKGGALRNVPIGGGCRKNKNGTTTTLVASKSSSGKLLKTISVPAGFDYELPPTSSHLWTLLRSPTSQNPNPSRNPISTHLMSSTGARAMGLDHQLLPNSMWRSNNQNPPQRNGTVLNNGDHVHHNLGMQELFIRSSASANYLGHDQRSQPVMLSNAGSNSSYVSDSAQALGDLGYGWNDAVSWSVLSTTNGACP